VSGAGERRRCVHGRAGKELHVIYTPEMRMRASSLIDGRQRGCGASCAIRFIRASSHHPLVSRPPCPIICLQDTSAYDLSPCIFVSANES
jgi:hypothetical protein